MFVFAIRIEHPLDLSVQCPHEPNSSEHCRAAQRRDQDQGLHRCLPFLCLVNGDWKPGDVIAGVLKGDKLATAGQGDRSSKARDQSATIPPRRADVGAAMIAHGAKRPGALKSNLEIIIVASPGSFFLFGPCCYEFRANFFAVDPGELATTVR